MSDNWERRILQSFGSHFRLDVNNPQTTVGGEDVYNFYSVTDEEKVCLVGHQQDGKYRIYNDDVLELVGGAKMDENGVNVVITGKNGDVVINADKNGRVRIRGQNITIQADEDVNIIAGRNATMSSGSGRVLLKGNTLEKTGLKGNLLEPNKQWAWRVFEGTGLPGGQFASLVSPFSGLTSLTGQLLSDPTAFSGFVQSSVQTAISGVTGGVISDLGSFTPEIPLGGVVSDITSDITSQIPL